MKRMKTHHTKLKLLLFSHSLFISDNPWPTSGATNLTEKEKKVSSLLGIINWGT